MRWHYCDTVSADRLCEKHKSDEELHLFEVPYPLARASVDSKLKDLHCSDVISPLATGAFAATMHST